MAISQIVIINNKGEISRAILEILEICIYSLKYL